MEVDWQGVRRCLDCGLDALRLDLSDPQRSALVEYTQLLARWGRSYNLTAVREPIEMVPRHLLDSLSILSYLRGDEVLDLGTGAGLPGIPLAIAAPQRRFVLLDSNGKKIRFVRQAAWSLRLDNVVAVQARLDAYRPPRKFATIVVRALGSLRLLHAAAEGLTARPGRLLAMKGPAAQEELTGPDFTDAELVTHALQVPFLEGARYLIEIRYD